VPSTIPEGKELSKVYDGNTDVPASVLAVIGNSQSDYFTFSGVMEGDTVSLKNTFNGTFDNRNVKSDLFPGAEKITITSLEVDNPNYILNNKSFDIPAEITPKGVTVKVNDSSYE
ncbi:MAG: YDG domain-containing protein, partial [Clostridia bacterium]|nr:YDG domain-containing protein [Clostridia bacterium]